MGMRGKSIPGVNSVDVKHTLGRCIVEQARTLAKSPKTRANAETNLGQAAQEWAVLSEWYPEIAMYREWQANAYQARGYVRIEMNKPAEAQADFQKSRQLLEELVKESPARVDPRGDLGRTYAGLGRLAQLTGDAKGAAEWFGKAADVLRQAVNQARMSPGTIVRWTKSRPNGRGDAGDPFTAGYFFFRKLSGLQGSSVT